MKILFTFIISILILFGVIYCRADDTSSNNYLSKPTGEYGIGFRDFHWINKDICPDPMFTGKNKDDYSKNNPKYCREIVARVYYPTFIESKPHIPYYQPFIKGQKERLVQVPGVKKQDIAQLNQIKSFALKKAKPITEKSFPVIFFSPGYGCSIEIYENFITDLVSHGYIVIGINSPFVSGDIELPNRHIIKATQQMNVDEILKNILPIQSNDFSYVFEQIHKQHNANLIFSSMDLKHIGAFGHSLGALVVADTAQAHPNWFQAAATLDVGGNSTIKKLNIPFMHEISASFMHMVPVTFELGKNGYVVSLTPNPLNYDYSYHMNFSDMSTLQYLPAYRAVAAYLDGIIKIGCDLKFLSHDPTKEEIGAFNKTTYVFIKKQNKWILSYYEAQEKICDVDPSMIKNLDAALSDLPSVPPERLTESEIEPIKKIITYVFIFNHTQFGNGDGWKITSAINTYLVQFFNTFLKGQENPAFKKCNSLTDDTLIRCGYQNL